MKTDRAKSYVDPGTIGSLACEKSLAKILAEIDSAKTTNRVMSRYFRFKIGLSSILKMASSDQKFALVIVRLWLKESLESVYKSKQHNKWTEDLYSHLLCCMKAQARITERRIKAL